MLPRMVRRAGFEPAGSALAARLNEPDYETDAKETEGHYTIPAMNR